MENEEKKNANEATSKELAQAICLALSAKKAKDIATVYVREKSSLCDYFVIASGTSSTQVRAMGEYVEEQMEKQFSLSPVREEGMRDGSKIHQYCDSKNTSGYWCGSGI